MNTCSECGDKFNPYSPEKRRAGGLFIHCADCSEETSVRCVGVTGSSGKMVGVEILHFDSQEDREEYVEYWKNNSGMYKSKSCQLTKLKATPNIRFKKSHENHPNVNHKGKF